MAVRGWLTPGPTLVLIFRAVDGVQQQREEEEEEEEGGELESLNGRLPVMVSVTAEELAGGMVRTSVGCVVAVGSPSI